LITTRASRPGIFAPTRDSDCGTTYPVEVATTSDCAGEISATSVRFTACLYRRSPIFW
jgi:hypothetical protein